MSGPCLLRIILLLCCCQSVLAQPLSFRHITSAQGLLSDQRINVAEDKIGRIWIASDEGVNVFDGQELQSFNYPDNSGLQHNNVTQIFCDNRGTIWVSHNHGIQYRLSGDHQFRSVNLPMAVNNEGLQFAETGPGLLVVTRNGCFLIDSNYQVKEDKILSRLVRQYRMPACVVRKDDEEVFFGFYDSLRIVNIPKRSIVRGYAFPYAWTVCRVDSTRWMAGSFSKPLVTILDLQTGQEEPVNHWASGDGRPLGGYAGTIMAVDDHRFAMASRYYGLYIIDVQKKFIQHIEHDPGNASSILSNYCRNLFVSRDKTLFVHSRGLSYTSMLQPRLKSVKQLIDTKGNRYNSVINCFYRDPQDKLWLGTNAGLYCSKGNSDTGTMIPFLVKDNDEWRPKTIRDMAVDAKQRIWVATFGAGLGRLEGNQFVPAFKRGDKDLPEPYPSDIYAMIPAGDIFLLCSNSGLTGFDPVQNKGISFTHHPALWAVARHRTYHVLIDVQGNWWLAQREGLFHFDTKTQTLTAVPVPGQQGDQSIQTVAQDSLGNVYAGGYTGLYIYPGGRLNEPVSVRKKDGLTSSNVIGLVCDRRGLMWVIGNRGLASYDPSTKELQSYDERDGLLPGNHKFSAYYLSPDGKVYVGGEDGYNYFDPAALGPKPAPLQVFVVELIVQDSIISVSGPERITLNHNRNNISFAYLSVDHRSGPYLQYRYKLEGLDSNFVYAGRQRTARYTNLKAGDYRFLVEVSANGKDWFAALPLPVTIGLAFWKTTWFLLSMIGLLLLMTWAWYRYRISQVRREAQIRADYEIRLNDLENSALRAQMNPHFIFNCLNTINAFVNRNEKAQANHYISRFSRLIRLILDHSRQRNITLEEELNALELYLQIEQVRFEGRFNYQIEIDEKLDAANTEIPSLLIQPFAENAIVHGLLPAGRPGLIRIAVVQEADHLLIVVEDDGVGREAAASGKLKTPVEQRSHGMDITMKRVALFNREHAVNVEPMIIDLKDEQGNARGTRVEIRLAFEKSI